MPCSTPTVSQPGIYRKSHIPDGPGYHEKYYFNPGDSGFRVWDTRYARIGVGICWDQWFPESARSMALLGAEILFYPTAIGSEPHDPSISSRDHWHRVQQGHAGANLMPLVASNRIGREAQDDYEITFYGSSFIADQFGAKVEELDQAREGVLVHSFDLDQLEHIRSAWACSATAGRPSTVRWRPSMRPAASSLGAPTRAGTKKRGSAPGRGPPRASQVTPMTPLTSTPRADGFRMPAEWEPRSQTWMIWPERPDNWRNGAKPAQAAFAAVACAIAEFEEVSVCVSAGQYENARARLDHPRIRLVEISSDDAWVRDTGPTFLIDDAGQPARRGLDLQRLGRFRWRPVLAVAARRPGRGQDPRDRTLPALPHRGFCPRRRRDPRRRRRHAAHHRGDACSTATASAAQSRPDRGPAGRAAGHGLRDLAAAGAVQRRNRRPCRQLLLLRPPRRGAAGLDRRPRRPQLSALPAALRVLEAARDARGRALVVHRMPIPGPLHASAEECAGIDVAEGSQLRSPQVRLAASYINFLIVNGGIIAPRFDDPKDAEAEAILRRLFPGATW